MTPVFGRVLEAVFARPQSSRRPGWALVLLVCNIAVVSAATIELGARGFVYAFENWRPDARALADGYDGAEWPREYYRELRASSHQEWRPYVYWRRLAFSGRYIRVNDEGIRHT